MSNSENQLGEGLAQLDWNSSNIDPSLEEFSFQGNALSQSIMSYHIQQHTLDRSSQESQQDPRVQNPTMQRFVEEPQRQFFTAPNLTQGLRGGMLHASLPISYLPRPSNQRMDSPSLSQGFTSVSESVESPRGEPDFYSESRYSVMDSQYSTQSSSIFQGGSTYQSYAFPPYHGSSCVTMDQVQSFADVGDAYYGSNDEQFEEIVMKGKYDMNSDQDHNHYHDSIHTISEVQGYGYPSDEGIGDSVRDEASPKDDIFVDEVLPEMDVDGDMDDMDNEHIPVTPMSDAEYTPQSTRTRKRRVSPVGRPMAPSAKRNKVLKASAKSKGLVTCKFCNHAPFKDTATLQRHMVSTHTRAYVCVFSFAGCPSTFASKNEWKRHVSSQHINLEVWVCEQGACGNIHSKSGHLINGSNRNVSRGMEFNRKDLFTQHLRRMHVPVSVKRKKTGSDAGWEDTVRALQQTCLRMKRQAPTRLDCPVHDCLSHFEGTGCLDDRMEHVGKHLEEQAQGKVTFNQGDDVFLVEWALDEDIIEQKATGVFRLKVGGAGSGRRAVKMERMEVNMDHEEDAEGDDDDE
ncbi:hypothetical protein WAI453_000314 [Rhynchosporium graminicola]|uniref:C2H2-type domain-containing protein n=1 Tax=Rhynchosporium graminicola TaxID=2792576 RepID=A0A1E1JQC7_9HELO|nr:uncharacterized protein RCO7_00892 [Rhynchosporium commune]